MSELSEILVTHIDEPEINATISMEEESVLPEGTLSYCDSCGAYHPNIGWNDFIEKMEQIRRPIFNNFTE